MGININPSLLLNEDTFDINTLCSVPVIESYYLPSLDVVHEVNTMFRHSHLELYKIIGMVDEGAELDPIQEANIIKVFAKKIGEIFDSIVKAIKKIKDFIVAQFTKIIAKAKMKIEKKVMEQIKKLPGLYDSSMYFTLDLYSNVLKDNLTDPNIPDRDLIYTNKNFDNFIDKINTVMAFDFSNGDALNQYTTKLKEETERDRRDLRSSLAGVKSTTEDLNDIVAFKKQLTNFYIGEQSSRRVDGDFLFRAIENVGNYFDMISKMTTVKNEIDKKYNDLMNRVNKLRKNTDERIAMVTGTQEEDYYMKVSNTVIALSNMVNGYLQDHMTSYMVKLDCMVTMQNQDIDIINRVKNLVSKAHTNESYTIERDLEDGMEKAYMEYCENCFLLREHVDRVHLNAFVNESVFLTEADKDPNFVMRIINMITSMFKKFLTNLNQLIGIDKKWFDQNEKKIKSNDFKFPGQDNIGEWIPYRREMLTKPFNVPVFNMDDNALLDTLKDDDSFAKFLFGKIGANESMLQDNEANGSFTNKCKAVYAGGEAKDISPADLTKDKDAMFDYCKNYNQGEGGGIYKSIVADTNKLDQSKKSVMRALNSYVQPERKPDNATPTNQTDADKEKTDDNKPNTDATASTDNEHKEKENTPKGENTLDLASLLGISESTNILQELTTPDIAKEDKNGMKENIKAGGGDTDEGMKTLKEKATRYFTMTGNALGAKMTASMQCYKQYKQIFKWALKSTTDRPTTNADTTANPEDKNNADNKPADNNANADNSSIAAEAQKK